MLRIGDFEIKSGVVQSPMAACTDLAFRLVARRRGMEFAFLEMVSADALIHESRKTVERMKSIEEDQPLGIQLVGCHAESMGQAAKIVEEMDYFKVIDLNLGCPVNKIAGHHAGSGLLKEPDRAEAIFESVRNNVKKTPLTVKMRIGYNDESGDEAIDIAKRAEKIGFSAIAVHGRTRNQGYQGKANYEVIGRIKEAVNISVIGNGDIMDANSAIEMKRISGCDAVMIGRGALGNPWIYEEVQAGLEGKAVKRKVSFLEKKATLLEHFDLLVKYYPRTAKFSMRRVGCWYFNGYPGAVQFRTKLNRTEDLTEIRQLIEAFHVEEA